MRLLRDWRTGIPTIVAGWVALGALVWWIGEPTQEGLRSWIGLFWLLVLTPIFWIAIARHRSTRTKPEGYIGKFQRPDGVIVHVARLSDRTLMVASESQPPVNLGTVTGPELAHWTKLATEPDG